MIDHQEWVSGNCCEGCYCAIAHTHDGTGCRCRVIGQVFSCDRYGDDPDGYFAIRMAENGQPLHTVDAGTGKPVLPAFGCVDVAGLLLSIDNISTVKQAVEISVR